MTKEELSKYYYLKQEIKQIEDKIEEIDSTFMRASLINCEKFERKLSNPQEKRMILIEKYEQKLEIAINKSIGCRLRPAIQTPFLNLDKKQKSRIVESNICLFYQRKSWLLHFAPVSAEMTFCNPRPLSLFSQ